MKVQIIKLDPEARIPEYKTSGSAGADLYALEDTSIQPEESALVRTGLSMAVPKGFEVQIRPRSGLALKRSWYDIPNSPGTIDSDYRGEVCVLVRNLSKKYPVRLNKGNRIAQMVLCPVFQAEFEEVEELPETERGSGGFGSTGI